MCVGLYAYLLTARQTVTAPRDAPWLLLTGTARWPGAKTQKHAHTHSQKMKHLLKHNHSDPRRAM